jgi:hypothetical protein
LQVWQGMRLSPFPPVPLRMHRLQVHNVDYEAK